MINTTCIEIDGENLFEMGSNDLYLIKKLKESGITLKKLDVYLRKIYLALKDQDKGVSTA